MLGRKSVLWFAAAISVLTFGVVSTANGSTRERPCNGSVDLCGKTFDQVVMPGTHNSMSNSEYEWMMPNQHYSIPSQLSMGIRAFLIDTHYGKPGTSPGEVVSWKNGSDGDPRTNNAGTYLCHTECAWGATPLAEELGKIKDFLAANPREVLTFVVQNGIHPEDYAKSVTESGLIDFVYTGSTSEYPTVREMIASNQRAVMLSEGNTGSVPWFHNGYAGPLQETPYNFRNDELGTALTTRQGMAQLTDAANLNSSCRSLRGGTEGQLFLMNHWVNGLIDTGTTGNTFTPDAAVSQVLNQKDVLINRARACEQRRGKVPTILAVDGFGDGDLIGAVRDLNGVTAKSFFEVIKPKKAAVKAGKKATFRINLSNWGDSASTATRVCAAVPGRLAIKPKCKTISVPLGNPGTAATSLTVVTRRIVQGRFKGKKNGPVTFTVSGAGDVVKTSTNLKVTPIKKKKPKRKKKTSKR